MRKCRRYCRNGMQVEKSGKRAPDDSSDNLLHLLGFLVIPFAVLMSFFLTAFALPEIVDRVRFNDLLNGSSPLTQTLANVTGTVLVCILVVLVFILALLVSILVFCGIAALCVLVVNAVFIVFRGIAALCSIVVDAVFSKSRHGKDTSISHDASETTDDRSNGPPPEWHESVLLEEARRERRSRMTKTVLKLACLSVVAYFAFGLLTNKPETASTGDAEVVADSSAGTAGKEGLPPTDPWGGEAAIVSRDNRANYRPVPPASTPPPVRHARANPNDPISEGIVDINIP